MYTFSIRTWRERYLIVIINLIVLIVYCRNLTVVKTVLDEKSTLETRKRIKKTSQCLLEIFIFFYFPIDD